MLSQIYVSHMPARSISYQCAVLQLTQDIFRKCPGRNLIISSLVTEALPITTAITGFSQKWKCTPRAARRDYTTVELKHVRAADRSGNLNYTSLRRWGFLRLSSAAPPFGQCSCDRSVSEAFQWGKTRHFRPLLCGSWHWKWEITE